VAGRQADPMGEEPRTHSDAQVAQIAASIAEFGFNSPILVNSHAGIIAGHGRLLAAPLLHGSWDSPKSLSSFSII